MKNRLFLLLLATTTIFLGESHVTGGTKIPRLRGIPVAKMSLYAADRNFECLDGSRVIPFSQVNDDYCDCADGSDEPGTSACPNGFFYCQNLGHQAAYIPSKWVNDGVCDCCDASDEYDSNQTCIDNCNELGLEARLAAQKVAELAREGNKVRMQMIAKGKQLKSEYQERLGKLRVDSEEAERTKQEKEALKKVAEEREEAALAKYKPPTPEKLEQPEETAPNQDMEAAMYFSKLDSDGSSTVTVAELQTRVIFDKDRNGEVSEEEALFFLNNSPQVSMDEFIEKVWPNIKPFLMLEKGLFKPEIDEKEKHEEHRESEPLDDENDDEDDEDSDPEQDDVQPHDDDGDNEPEQQEEEPPVQYDEETQSLIDDASTARRNYEDAEKTVRDLQSEINRLEDKIERDYGPEEEFAAIDGQCFEYNDLEYIYTLCMFDRATQKSKSGGSDVSLGIWNEWTGPEKAKYKKMKYDRGLTCWNGPARSTTVTLSCGVENKLVSVTEPSRCEYAFEFVTPGVCHTNGDETDTHDEL